MIDAMNWRRLDGAGHDSCRLVERESGFRLEGTAAFRKNGEIASLCYEVLTDELWRTREASLCGWVGERTLELRILRTHDGIWTLNEQTAPDVEGLYDLDLGFTPATNLLTIKRLRLQIGTDAPAPVAWLDLVSPALETLEQHYTRLNEVEYRYEAPRFDYSAVLRVNRHGFVEEYPRMWKSE